MFLYTYSRFICDIHLFSREKIDYVVAYNDLPMEILDTFIQYLDPNNKLPFHLNFRADKREFGVLEINKKLWFYNNEDYKNTDCLPNFKLLKPYDAIECVQSLAKLAIEDIERDFDNFLYWGEGEIDTRNIKIIKRRRELLEKLDQLQTLIKKET